MATLYEYFVKDGTQNLTTQQVWHFEKEGVKQGDLTARLHLDFDANAKYVSFFIPEMPNVVCPEAIALNTVAEILAWPETLVGVQTGMGKEVKEAQELMFTGQVYLYSERPVSDDFKIQFTAEANKFGQKLTFRSVEYANAREKWERPLAFISHDSRDKIDIAEPIALRLQKLMCPVWYDQFSLRIGDSLRESIERELRKCKKCVLTLTLNFLAIQGGCNENMTQYSLGN
jgi:hypothetical protein